MSIKQNALALTLCLPFSLIATLAHSEMVIEDAYARASSPVAKSGAAFMQISNTSDQMDHLIEARSEAAMRVELHTHVEKDGVMSMVHIEEGFAVAPGETIELARGGKHVMFMGLNAPFEQDETITLTLVFERAGEVLVTVPIDNERKAKHDHMHSGHGEHKMETEHNHTGSMKTN